MSIIDRYVIRQVLLPFSIGLLVFTFIFIIPPLIEHAELLVARGVAAPVVLRLMWTLIPQSAAITVPMSLLLGLLVGFGRLSGDREFVALQACGVSLLRLLRPVALIAILCWAVTTYVMIVAVPASNHAFREITFNVMASSAEGEVKPRVFFQSFPNLVLYVRDIRPGGGWDGVFMADSRPGQPQATYLAERGRVAIDRQKRTVSVLLEDVMRHTQLANGNYEVGRSDRIVLSVDPNSIFSGGSAMKGDREMTIGELRERMAELQRNGVSTHNQQIAIQRKFSIPIACLVFALIGLALGATNRRDGTLGSFVVGLAVIFAYYIPLNFGPQLAKGALIAPWVAAWLPNIVLGLVGIALFVWRTKVADQPIRIPVPASIRRLRLQFRASAPRQHRAVPRHGPISILDRYVSAIYARLFLLSAGGMAAIFYISTFIDLSDKVFKGTATWALLAQYFWFVTPQYVYYILPLAVLLAALITIGVLTKSSELIVMRACGISVYRVALPMLLCAACAGATLFLLEQSVLGAANRRAEAIRHVMRGEPAATFDILARQWLVGTDGTIYHYNFYDPRTHVLSQLDIYEFTPEMRTFRRRTYADQARITGTPTVQDRQHWTMERGWTRDFAADGAVRNVATFNRADKPMESVAYFGTEQPEAKFMSYTQLRGHVERLRSGGFDVLDQQVALDRKISFPFVTLIMTLLAIPFGLTTGRSGTMAGIGVGIALALTYWTSISLFAALGAGGVMAPLLAAWAPNLLFGAGAAYLFLAVRT